MKSYLNKLIIASRKRVAVVAATFATGLFGTGKGTLGQTGGTIDTTTPTSIISGLSAGTASQIVTGFGDQSMVIWSDGTLQGMGVSRVGGGGEDTPISLAMPGLQTILSDTPTKTFGSQVLAPVSKPAFSVIAAAICRASNNTLFSAIVCSDGNAYGSGDNGSSQLTGAPGSLTAYTMLSGMPGGGIAAINISCGISHTAVLMSNGLVYYTGSLNGLYPVSTLTLITGLTGGITITKIESAEHCIYGLGSNNIIYAMGYCPFCTQTTGWVVLNAQPAGGLVPVKIGAGINNLAIITNDGVVQGIGDNTNNELTGSGAVTIFTPFTGLPNGVEAVDVTFGIGFCLVTGSDGIVYHTGLGTLGQGTGTSNRTTLTACTVLPAGKYGEQTKAGKQHSIVKTNTILPNRVSFIQTYAVRQDGWVITTNVVGSSINYSTAVPAIITEVTGEERVVFFCQQSGYVGAILSLKTNGTDMLYKQTPYPIYGVTISGSNVHGSMALSASVSVYAKFTPNFDVISTYKATDQQAALVYIPSVYWTYGGVLYLLTVHHFLSGLYTRAVIRTTRVSDGAIMGSWPFGWDYHNIVYSLSVTSDNWILVHSLTYVNASIPYPMVWLLQGYGGTFFQQKAFFWSSANFTSWNFYIPSAEPTETGVTWVTWYNSSTGNYQLGGYILGQVSTTLFNKTYTGYSSGGPIEFICRYIPYLSTSMLGPTTCCFVWWSTPRVLMCIGTSGEVIWARSISNCSVRSGVTKNDYLYLNCGNTNDSNNAVLIKYDILNAPTGTIGPFTFDEVANPVTTSVVPSFNATTTYTATLSTTTAYAVTGTQAAVSLAITWEKTSLPANPTWKIVTIRSLVSGNRLVVETCLMLTDRYVLCGLETGSLKKFIISLDFNGNIIRSITFSASHPKIVLFRASGTDQIGYTAFINSKAMVYILDKTLTVLNQYRLSRTDNLNGDSHNQFFTMAPNGDYYIAFFETYSGYGRWHVVKRSSNGTLLWAYRYYAGYITYTVNQLYRMHLTTNTLLLHGYIYGSPTSYNILIAINASTGSTAIARIGAAGTTTNFNIILSSRQTTMWAEFMHQTTSRITKFNMDLSGVGLVGVSTPNGESGALVAEYSDGSYITVGRGSTTTPILLRKLSSANSILRSRNCIVSPGSRENASGVSVLYEFADNTFFADMGTNNLNMVTLQTPWPAQYFNEYTVMNSNTFTAAYGAAIQSFTVGTVTVSLYSGGTPPTLIAETVTQFPAGEFNSSHVTITRGT